MPTIPTHLPRALEQLPPLPQALTAALRLIRDQASRRSDLVQVLSLDQGLTALFLRMVNSAYYGMPRRVTSLDEAIGYLGYETVESTIFAVSASKLLSKPVQAYMMERGTLWRHSVAVASGCQWISRAKGIVPESELYVAGLLHDVGKLVMDLVMDYRTYWHEGTEGRLESRNWVEVERLVTGYDHPELGSILARRWNLPDRVVEAIACHHAPDRARLDRRLAAAVHLADAAAMMAGIGLGIDGLSSALDPTALQTLDWSEADMEGLIDTMQASVHKAMDILGMDA